MQIANNLAQLTTEFKPADIKLESISHSADGTNYIMVTMQHNAEVSRQHIGIALDFSTSMQERVEGISKRKILIDSAKIAMEQMNDDDLVTVVAYGSRANVIMRNVRVGNPDTIPSIVRILYSTDYMGRTNPSIALAELVNCDQTLLLSDGCFNEGITDPSQMYNVVRHSIMCGSIFPGTDMSELAEISEGTYFNLNCKNAAHMKSLLASSLSAPLICASNVVLTHGSATYTLPSIRAGCMTRFVFKAFGDTLTLKYTDDNNNPIELNHTFCIVGNSNHEVARQIVLQKAAELGAKSLKQNDDGLRRTSYEMFSSIGINITCDNDLAKTSSSQQMQFSVDPSSMYCPEVCRSSSKSSQSV